MKYKIEAVKRATRKNVMLMVEARSPQDAKAKADENGYEPLKITEQPGPELHTDAPEQPESDPNPGDTLWSRIFDLLSDLGWGLRRVIASMAWFCMIIGVERDGLWMLNCVVVLAAVWIADIRSDVHRIRSNSDRATRA